MSNYAVEFTKSAQKEFSKLPRSVIIRIATAIDGLRMDPRKGNVRPMVGGTSWRLRVGDHRVIYDIFDGRLLVLVIRVRHRKDVYKK